MAVAANIQKMVENPEMEKLVFPLTVSTRFLWMDSCMCLLKSFLLEMFCTNHSMSAARMSLYSQLGYVDMCDIQSQVETEHSIC